MRLIDGNKIVMSLAYWWYSSFGQEETEESKAIKKVMEQVEKMVMEMPEIVRCKDCKHRTMTGWSRYEEGMYRYVYNCDKGIIYDIKDSDFCSYGEKLQLSRETSTNAKDICEQIKKHAERIKAETDKNPDSLWSKGMRSFDGWELTSKLNNLDDFLLREDLEGVKEKKSKLESDTISRQAAIEALKKWFAKEYNDMPDEFDDIARMLMNALPPVEPKPVCEDAISRQDAIEALEHINIPTQAQREYAIEILENIPPVEPDWPKGEWVEYIDDMNGARYGRCTSCNKSTLNAVSYDLDGQRYIMDFCPNCGADCRGEKE